MSKKGAPKEWVKEFQSFLLASPIEPPKNLSSTILNKVNKDLNPSAWLMFTKLAGIQLITGIITLLFCPQFGLSFSQGPGLMSLLMSFGETVCMAGCGAVFLVESTLAATLFLRPEEIKVMRKTKYLQVPILAMFSLGTLICFGANVIATLGLAWLTGGVLAGLASLELGWVVRSYVLKRRMASNA